MAPSFNLRQVQRMPAQIAWACATNIIKFPILSQTEEEVSFRSFVYHSTQCAHASWSVLAQGAVTVSSSDVNGSHGSICSNPSDKFYGELLLEYVQTCYFLDKTTTALLSLSIKHSTNAYAYIYAYTLTECTHARTIYSSERLRQV